MVTEANKQFNVSSNFLSQMDDLGKQQMDNVTITKKNLALASYSIETNQNPVFIYSTISQTNLSVKISSNDERSYLQNIKAYIMLPPQLFMGKNKTQVYSYVFSENNVFFAGHSTKINSVILSATINGQNVNKTNYPISMMFLRDTNTTGSNTCQFYKTIEQVWSAEGCNTTKSSTEEVFCQCNHLTNFALILDTDQSGYNPLSLQIVSWIGCGISIAGLFFTILSYLIFPKLRSNLSSQILLNLCVSLMLTMIIFLSLVERTQPQLLCKIVASLLQYFILSTFFWMAVEGINLYIMFVKVFRGSYRSRIFMLKSCGFAWGVPLIVTVVTAAVKPANLGPLTDNDPKICIVRGISFYCGILLPICMVIIVNFIFLFLVLRGIGANSNVANRIDIKKKARIALGCSLLLGTTWIFAVLAVGSLRDVFQWLFCIFNSLQGFFIFVFYVAQNNDVRNQWRSFLGKRNATKETVSSSENRNQTRSTFTTSRAINRINRVSSGFS
ncbi:adhesion G-protein coupled receptor G2 isoform X1 [Hydra vulgaris]|uniref:adhesion G-protein coupled receptor G2 isoform X1 n=1 Tax=Hydra vulgaris TaxID=6087 RepID=UPI0032EA608C